MSDEIENVSGDSKKTFQSMPKPVPTRELDSVDRERIELNRRDTAAIDPAHRPQNVAFAQTAELTAIPDGGDGAPSMPGARPGMDEEEPIASGGTFDGVPLPWRNSGEFRVAEEPGSGELDADELGAPEPTSVGALPWRESGRYRNPSRERVAEPPANTSFPPPPLPEYDQRQYADTLQNPEQQPNREQKKELNELLRAYLSGDKIPGK